MTAPDTPAAPDAAAPGTGPAAPGTTALDPALAARLKHDGAGLLTAVVQDARDQRVLMVGWMDDEALRRTLTTGRATYWSRSRGEHWRKGDTSGHVQWVRSVALDCDGDTLLVQVDQDRKSTRLNSSHPLSSRMPSSA